MNDSNSNPQTPPGTPHFDFNDLLEATSLEETNLAEGHVTEPARMRPIEEATIEDFQFGDSSLPAKATLVAPATESVNASEFHLSNLDSLGFALEEARAGVVSSEAKLRDEIIPAPRSAGTVRIKRSKIGGGRFGARRRGGDEQQKPQENAATTPASPVEHKEAAPAKAPATLHRHPTSRPATHRGPAPKSAATPTGKAKAKPGVARPAGGHDAVLERNVRAALETSGIAALMALDVSVQRGGVSLTGEVESATQKQMAMDLARGVRGVARIHDMLTTARAPEPVVPVVAAVAAQVAAPMPAAAAAEAEAKYAAAQAEANAARLAQFKAEQARQEQMRRSQTSRSSGSSGGGMSFENPFKDISIPGGWGTVAGVVVAAVAVWYFGFTGAGGARITKLPVSPVTGKVLFDGKPPVGAIVRMIPTDPNMQKVIGSSVGIVEADGTFKTRTYPGGAPDGAPNGDYLVVFFWFKPEDLEKENNQFPPDYSRPSKFHAKVNGSTTLPTFELKSDGSGPS